MDCNSTPRRMIPRRIELLAPAKNADFGIEAINHGADAVYIGGPSFGARYGAGNEVADIARLAAHAHRFDARVFVALNTILFDHELEDARRLAWALYEAGADALIVQDMGLLELDLPPIQLHASTQTDIRDAAKARFLADVGFSQIVLARELSLRDIRRVAAATPETALEFFVHGALCVAFSGQCYISHAHTGRSANRGECSQACRLPYDLADADGQVLASSKHLLSMKDNDQSANLAALIEAGITSFKIEGRLKDLGYVKNITAHYRTLLDTIIDADPGLARAASGRCTYTFTPRPEKTFNRGGTDYFVNGRQPDIGAFETPKFTGELAGKVTRLARDHFEVAALVDFANGDGVSWFTPEGELDGVRIERVDGRRLYPAEMPAGLSVGTEIHRNHDQAFVRALEKPSAVRRIAVRLTLTDAGEALALTLNDADGHRARIVIDHAREAARDPERARSTLAEQLNKLGGTDFVAEAVDIDLPTPWFLPASTVNALRRDGIAALAAVRREAWQRLPRRAPVEPPVPYPQGELSYLGNVLNERARTFYARHGVQVIADAYEKDHEKGMVSLMITKHCLRYSYNLCPKEVRGISADPMTLVNGKEKLTLVFDCKKCEMHVVGKMKAGKGRVLPLKAV